MKDVKDEDQFEEIEDFEDASDVIEDIDSIDSDHVDSEEDVQELERRRLAYSHLKKEDKIFNNSFNMGTAADDQEEHRSRSEIKVDPGSVHYHLYDRDKHSDYVDDSITQFDINEFISSSSEIKNILGDTPEKKKFTKSEINELFDKIRDGVSRGDKASVFINSIHVLDAISSLTSLEYKKIFDMLTYENKEVLLIELNKKYKFLERAPKDFKIF